MVLLVGMLGFAGCGSDDSPTDPGGGGGGGGIGGTAFSALVVQAINNGGIIGIGASDANSENVLGFGWVDTGEPSYDMEVGSAATGTVVRSSGGTWQAGGDLGSGTITVSTLTATRVTGSFFFTADGVIGTENPASLVVASGTFDAEF